MSELQGRVDRSTAWVAFASLVLGVLDLLSTLICIRFWVSTADFGAATLAIALFPILDRLGGMGLSSAVVREADSEPKAQSTIFWLGFGASMLVFAILAIARPAIGALFPDAIVGSLLAAYGVRLVINSFAIIPDAMLKRELRYRELSLVKMIASLADTGTKLGLAYVGAHGIPELSIWCFALGPIANTVVSAIGLQICYRWRPRFAFRREIAVRAARFTASISGGELLYYAYTSADYLVIGTYFGDAAVGVYRLAYELVLDVVRLLSMVTAEVAFPTFVRLSADRRAVSDQLLRFTRQNLIVLGPFLAFVAIEADDLLALLYPPMPASAATVARILCCVGALRTLGFILPALLAGIGQASRVLIYNALAAVVLPAMFVIAAHVAPEQGYVSIAWAWAAGYPIAFAALLAMALSRSGTPLPAYLRSIGGIFGCIVCSLVAGLAIRRMTFETHFVRAFAVGAVVLASYALLLARVEKVTPAAVVRSLRSP
ncbi:MAG: flippase family protein [Myxococcales bacterium]|nr:flippase family protein [Myxococcales bacterium]